MIFHRYTRFQPQELQHKGKAPCIVAVCSLDCKHIVIVSVLHHASRMEWPLLASTFGIVWKLDRRYDSKHQNWQKKNLVLGGPRFAIAHRGVASHRSMALTMVVAWSARLLEIDYNCGEKNAMKNSDADHSWPLPDWSLKHDWLKDVHVSTQQHEVPAVFQVHLSEAVSGNEANDSEVTKGNDAKSCQNNQDP